MSPAERLDTMIRMRGDTTGGVVYGWLDAVRSTFVDGDIRPMCRMLAATVSRFERRDDQYEATVLEVAYYLDPKTNELLKTFRFPGASQDVNVPVYRTGPVKVRFGIDFSEWEEHTPGEPGKATAAFAPKSSVHLERNVGFPTIEDGNLFLRTDEYGRVYPDKTKPPTVFYREWMIWQARADALLQTRAPNVPATFAYSALSSWRPWMQLGDIKGHTAENGHGAKAESIEKIPAMLRDLIKARDPDVLADPVRALGP
ncbi:MAG: DUF1838 family protein [Rhodospirillaceae bacterium]|nr:DUF1838 family protein [Rhodospirillaceae bacterium]